MRRILVTIVALASLLLLATPAWAASVRVNAAENLTDSGSTGSCQVHRTISDEVIAFCFSDGRTWFKVRVRGVTGEITRLQAAETGDCSGQRIKGVRRGDSAFVKIINVGEFRCTYSTVTVRFSS